MTPGPEKQQRITTQELRLRQYQDLLDRTRRRQTQATMELAWLDAEIPRMEIHLEEIRKKAQNAG